MAVSSVYAQSNCNETVFLPATPCDATKEYMKQNPIFTTGDRIANSQQTQYKYDSRNNVLYFNDIVG